MAQPLSFFEQALSFLAQLLSFLAQLACLAYFLLHEPAPQPFCGLSWAMTVPAVIRVVARRAMDWRFMVKSFQMKWRTCGAGTLLESFLRGGS